MEPAAPDRILALGTPDHFQPRGTVHLAACVARACPKDGPTLGHSHSSHFLIVRLGTTPISGMPPDVKAPGSGVPVSGVAPASTPHPTAGCFKWQIEHMGARGLALSDSVADLGPLSSSRGQLLLPRGPAEELIACAQASLAVRDQSISSPELSARKPRWRNLCQAQAPRVSFARAPALVGLAAAGDALLALLRHLRGQRAARRLRHALVRVEAEATGHHLHLPLGFTRLQLALRHQRRRLLALRLHFHLLLLDLLHVPSLLRRQRCCEAAGLVR